MGPTWSPYTITNVHMFCPSECCLLRDVPCWITAQTLVVRPQQHMSFGAGHPTGRDQCQAGVSGCHTKNTRMHPNSRCLWPICQFDMMVDFLALPTWQVQPWHANS
jgi:hypothetical protein